LNDYWKESGTDILLLTLIVFPMFLSGMHFMTAWFKQRYTKAETQILFTPLALVPLFYATNQDVKCLSVLVLFQHLYIAWYAIDLAESWDENRDLWDDAPTAREQSDRMQDATQGVMEGIYMVAQ